MALKTIRTDGDLGQPEPGAAIIDVATGQPAGEIVSVNKGGTWRLPLGLKPGRYRVMLPYEWEVPDFSAAMERPLGGEESAVAQEGVSDG